MPFFSQFPKIDYDFAANGIDTKIIDLFRFVKASDVFLDDMSIYQYYQVRNGDRPDVVSHELYGTTEYYWTFFLINEHLKTGLSGWPMSPDQFEDYMDLEYGGTVLSTRPVIVRDGDGLITEFRNSLADRFTVGETVTGLISGATGIVVSKDTQLSQLLLRAVDGVFQESELIVGSLSADTVTTLYVYDHRDAPHHYEDANGLISYNALQIDEQRSPEGMQEGVSNSELTAVSNYEYETQLNDERANIRVLRPTAVYKFAQAFRDLIND